VVKVALGLVAFAIKLWLGLLFYAVNAVYFWREIRGGTIGDHERVGAAKAATPRHRPHARIGGSIPPAPTNSRH
jgi:cation:H+ antiporter